MCQLLEVSRSGYYEWLNHKPSKYKIQDQILTDKIKQIYDKSKKRYGSPRIYNELRSQNYFCSKTRVERLMRENGIRARYKKKYRKTTDSNHSYPVAPNILNRNFNIDQPNKVWVSDITYIRTLEGWLYLAIVLDLYSRKIVGWTMSNRIDTNLVSTALNMAIKNRRPPKGLILHSDRGVQYASRNYQELLHENNIICSMSRKGNCWDNAVAESFFSTLKQECIEDNIYPWRKQARNIIFEYIEVFYNRQRKHSAIGYKTPEFYENLRKCA